MKSFIRPVAIITLIQVLGLSIECSQYTHPFQDPALGIEERVDNITSLMTLDEKIATLGMGGFSIPRLGIIRTSTVSNGKMEVTLNEQASRVLIARTAKLLPLLAVQGVA